MVYVQAPGLHDLEFQGIVLGVSLGEQKRRVMDVVLGARTDGIMSCRRSLGVESSLFIINVHYSHCSLLVPLFIRVAGF